MKYTTKVVINKPRAEVIDKLDSLENMKHWQRGLEQAIPLEGTPGQQGATMKLVYATGKRKMEMIETITKRNLPEEFHATYKAKGVFNVLHNYFKELEPEKTEWISESEFQFKGLGMKLIGFLMPGAFKKQSQKYLNDFKNFVEKGISVADE